MPLIADVQLAAMRRLRARRYYRQRLARGLCIRCAQPREAGRVYCARHDFEHIGPRKTRPCSAGCGRRSNVFKTDQYVCSECRRRNGWYYRRHRETTREVWNRKGEGRL